MKTTKLTYINRGIALITSRSGVTRAGGPDGAALLIARFTRLIANSGLDETERRMRQAVIETLAAKKPKAKDLIDLLRVTMRVTSAPEYRAELSQVRQDLATTATVPIINTELAVNALQPLGRSKLTGVVALEATYATRPTGRRWVAVDMRESRPVLAAFAQEVIGLEHQNVSKLNLLAHMKNVADSVPGALFAPSSVIALLTLHQFVNAKTAKWMERNAKHLASLAQCLNWTDLMRSIPILRNRDGDIESRHTKAWRDHQEVLGDQRPRRNAVAGQSTIFDVNPEAAAPTANGAMPSGNVQHGENVRKVAAQCRVYETSMANAWTNIERAEKMRQAANLTNIAYQTTIAEVVEGTVMIVSQDGRNQRLVQHDPAILPAVAAAGVQQAINGQNGNP